MKLYEIIVDGKKITPNVVKMKQNNNMTDLVRFIIPKTNDGIDISQYNIRIELEHETGSKDRIRLEKVQSGDSFLCDWAVERKSLQIAGFLYAELQLEGSSGEEPPIWQSDSMTIIVEETIRIDDIMIPDTMSELTQWTQQMENLNSQAQEAVEEAANQAETASTYASSAAASATSASASASKAEESAENAATSEENAKAYEFTIVNTVNNIPQKCANALVSDTAESETIIFSDRQPDTHLNTFTIYGVSQQDGTPTPDTPVEVVSVEDFDVVCSGKNLINESNQWYSQYGNVSSTFADGTWTITNAAGSGKSAVFEIGSLPAGTYTINQSTSKSLHLQADGKTIWQTDSFPKTFTFTAKKENVTITAYPGANTSITISNLQLEFGSAATQYTPYIAPYTAHITGAMRGIPDGTGGWAARDYIETDGTSVWKVQNVDETIDECTTESITNNSAYQLTSAVRTDITDTELGQALLSAVQAKNIALVRTENTAVKPRYKVNYNQDINKVINELKQTAEGCEKTENKGKPDGYAPLDSAGKIPNDYFYGKTVKEYGVRWKGTSSTNCERLGDAVGLVANAQHGVASTVQNDFDSIYPWSEMRLCNLDAEGNILAYANEPTFTRDGTNGDVMVQIPKFYYKRKKTVEGYEEWWICAVKLPGYELHPVFMDGGKEVSAVFHSAYNASSELLEDGKTTVLRSMTGVQPRVRTTCAAFRNYARNKGAGWGIEDIACVNALQMLYLVEYASTHSQASLGSGVGSLNYTATHLAVEAGENTNEFVTSTTNANKYRVGERIEIGTSQGSNNKTSTPRTITAITAREDVADISVITFDGDPVASIAVGNMIWNVAPLNGSCDDLNGGSGYIGINGKDDVAYRGIEGFHGKVFRFIDGVNIKDRVVYYANSTADYADGVYDGKYRAVGYTNAAVSGYVSEFGYDEIAPWVMFPSAAAGGSTTYVPDYYHQATGECSLLFGGYFAANSYIGAFCFYCGSGFSRSDLYSGAHLLIKKP